MKVLLCSLYLPSGRDGVSNSTRQLVSALEDKGVEVTVCTADWGWTEQEVINHQSDKVRVFKALFGNNFDLSLEMLSYFGRACADYDVGHFNSIYSFSTVLGSYFLRRKRVPHVVSPRGNFIPSSVKGGKGVRSAVKKAVFFKLFSRKALVNADKVICSSELEMEALWGQIRSDNIIYINNGLDPLPYQRAIDESIMVERLEITPEKPIFLFLGRLAEEKALPFLLDVWEAVIQKLPDARLVLAGSGEHGSYEKIQERVRQSIRPETILMPGEVTGDLKLALLKQSRALVLPSYFESFGNVVLESLASGTPVIASTGSPWRSLEKYLLGRWLPWDVGAWSDALLSISSGELYQGNEFSKRSRKWVFDNFSWSSIAEKYIEIYKEVMSRAKREA